MHDVGYRATMGLLVVAATLFSGCGGTQSIQALPPRPIAPVDTAVASLAEAGLARIDLRLRYEGAPLPSEVSRLRFRVAEIQFRESAGLWRAFPGGAGVISIEESSGPERIVLSTQLTPAQFDSVRVTFDDLYVEFDANAGGPLTTAQPPSGVRALVLRPQVGEVTRLEVVLNPGASLFRDAGCNWHFLPFLSIRENDQ